MENEIQEKLRAFAVLLNQQPDSAWIEATPDGKAKTLNISFVETNLDTIFNACWGTKNFVTRNVANEIVGELEFYFYHPVLEREFTRVGAAAIQITVDALSKEQKDNMSKQQINLHALNPENKKSNALDLGYSKLKAECLKNACLSLGKLFGRDLNRKRVSAPVPKLMQATDGLVNQLCEAVKKGDLTALDRAKFKGIVFDELQEVVINEALMAIKQLS
jgi:hypothetical protein